ncbi:hypothetical protein [Arthrobacter sp. JCM 19049]|uniref:hypothetical protein n=1 Tax=Arthrobacter sp. JCM 19049 TaxID=1460643 RepID=UPI000A978BA1|nr:hypothetical protein [Arthrobacter sp. JCM 19049]
MTIPDIGQRPRVPAATQVLVLSAAAALGGYLLALSLPAPHTWLLIPFATGTGLLIALAGGLEQAWMRILSAVLLAAVCSPRCRSAPRPCFPGASLRWCLCTCPPRSPPGCAGARR